MVLQHKYLALKVLYLFKIAGQSMNIKVVTIFLEMFAEKVHAFNETCFSEEGEDGRRQCDGPERSLPCRGPLEDLCKGLSDVQLESCIRLDPARISALLAEYKQRQKVIFRTSKFLKF